MGRGAAALAHLGVPFAGPVLPLVMLLTATHRPFVVRHARPALAFQVGFLIVYGLVTLAMFADLVPVGALLAALGGALVLEVPQIGLALAGRNPVRLVPGR